VYRKQASLSAAEAAIILDSVRGAEAPLFHVSAPYGTAESVPFPRKFEDNG
jgi:hypothetical protein